MRPIRFSYKAIIPIAVLACMTTASMVQALSDYEPIGLAGSPVTGNNSVVRCDVALSGGPATIHITSVPAGVVNYTTAVSSPNATVYPPLLNTPPTNYTLQVQTQGGTQVVSASVGPSSGGPDN